MINLHEKQKQKHRRSELTREIRWVVSKAEVSRVATVPKADVSDEPSSLTTLTSTKPFLLSICLCCALSEQQHKNRQICFQGQDPPSDLRINLQLSKQNRTQKKEKKDNKSIELSHRKLRKQHKEGAKILILVNTQIWELNKINN